VLGAFAVPQRLELFKEYLDRLKKYAELAYVIDR
jgi:hypothetical protein